MPGRKEQNKRDLKKASANCYQLDTFFKGIRKTVNESKNSFSENQNRSTPISLDLTNSSQDIPCTSKENNSPSSEHILNEEFQSSQLIHQSHNYLHCRHQHLNHQMRYSTWYSTSLLQQTHVAIRKT